MQSHTTLASLRRAWGVSRALKNVEARQYASEELGTSGAHRAHPIPTAPDGTADPGQEAGMATAEYAIGTLAAAAFAGLLLAVMRSGSVEGILRGLIEAALSVG